MKWLGRIALVLGTNLLAPWLLADDPGGFWQNEEQPAWIEIRFSYGTGVGTVRRNDNKPEAVGRVLLKDLVAQEGSQSWRGEIYAERLKEYRDAVLTLPAPDHMLIEVKAGLMSRTVSWRRVATIPGTDAPK